MDFLEHSSKHGLIFSIIHYRSFYCYLIVWQYNTCGTILRYNNVYVNCLKFSIILETIKFSRNNTIVWNNSNFLTYNSKLALFNLTTINHHVL